jgi:uncharacterized repeat protein (TIGR02543 family)
MELPIPSKQGHTFLGWASSNNATTPDIPENYIPQKNTTLYAVWHDDS